jgi:hypothetical protein
VVLNLLVATPKAGWGNTSVSVGPIMSSSNLVKNLRNCINKKLKTSCCLIVAQCVQQVSDPPPPPPPIMSDASA